MACREEDRDMVFAVLGTPSPAPDPIPEPGTLALFGLAALGYGIYRRRKSA